MKKILFIAGLLFTIFSVFSQTIQDFDKNTYTIVKIGTQEWLKENLRSIHYSDGTPVNGFMKYQNSDTSVDVYGLLYTWKAAMHDSTAEGVQGICPCGWHIPAESEWELLFSFLGGDYIAGKHLKEAGTSHWNSPNTSDNSSGFTALPAGYYNSDPEYVIGYSNQRNVLGLWSSTASGNYYAVQFAIANNEDNVYQYDWLKTDGYSIRCLNNNPVITGIFSIENSNIKVFPNPVYDFISIADFQNVQHLLIYNLKGNILMEKGRLQSEKINIKSFKAGTYIIKLINNIGETTYKIIKI